MKNVITAVFDTDRVVRTKPLWQYDYGQKLKLEGVELPDAYEVHFANEKHGNGYVEVGNADGADIPDACLADGRCVFAWVFLHEGESDGETEYMVTIPVNRRAKPTEETPTPVQQGLITQALAALNAAVEKTEENVTHYPTVVEGMWCVWDANAGAYVSTGVEAHGDTGNGIASVVQNADYTLTITFTNGDAFTTPVSVRGETGATGPVGETGATGNGIASITQNADYTLTVTFTDGNAFTTPVPVRGETGATGPVGATGATGPVGATGATGPVGATGATGAIGPKGDPFTVKKTFESILQMISYTGTDVKEGDFVVISSDTEDPDNGRLYLRGAVSWTFITDLSGAKGMKGEDGKGISTVVQNADYTLTITFTDGNDFTTGPVRGETGATGPVGATGATGAQGIQGVTGATGPVGATGATGPVGATGATGPVGATGATGETGPQGATGPVGATGATGPVGATGATGATGVMAEFVIGTVTGLPHGNNPTATIDNTDPAHPVLNLGIPAGASGNETIDDTAGLGDDDLVWSADKTTKELGNLKSAFDASEEDLKNLVGRLILDWEHGGMYYATGIEYSDTGKLRTGFVKVTPGETIVIYNPTEEDITVLQFASNTTTSSGVNEKVAGTSRGSGLTVVTIKDNANYIRLATVGHDFSEANGILVHTKKNIVVDDCKELFGPITRATKLTVDNVKTVVEDELFNMGAIAGVTYELGTINNGQSQASTTRARTTGHVLFGTNDALEVVCNPAIEYRVLLYTATSSSGFAGYANDFGDEAGIIQKDDYVSIRIIFRVKDAPNSDISSDNLAIIQQTIVNGLTSRMDNAEDQLPNLYSSDNIVPQDFYIGTISSSGGDDLTVTNRIITNYIKLNGSIVHVNMADGYDYRIAQYSDNNASGFIGYVNSWGDYSENYNPTGKYIRFLIRYKADTSSDITSNQIDYVATHTSIVNRLILDDVRKLIDNQLESFSDSISPEVQRSIRYFKIGALSENGVNENSTKHVRTSLFYSTNGIAKVQCNNPGIVYRVAVYTTTEYQTFEGYLNNYTNNTISLPQGKYIRIVARYDTKADIDESEIQYFREALVFVYNTDNDNFQTLQGKTVSIFGDSISTNGPDYIDEESQVPEIIIGTEDVGETLKATLTFRDFHPYYETDDEHALPLTVGGVTYEYDEITGSPTGTEITFVPTVDDVGKMIGKADSRNQAGMKVWWEVAAERLGFKVINSSYSGTCICRARSVPNDGIVQHYAGTYAWNISQIRRCGRRIDGTMNRISPDVIIIYRGTNDFGTFINGKAPAIDMSIFEQNAAITITNDTAGVAPARTPSEVDKDYYSFVNAYYLTVHELQKAYPRAKIFLCTIQDIRRSTYETYPIRTESGTLIQWNECIRAIARYMGCGIIDFARDGVNFFNYADFVYDPISGDGVHPGEEGQRIMGNRAIADLKAQYSCMDITSVEDVLNSDASQDVKSKYIWSGEFD